MVKKTVPYCEGYSNNWTACDDSTREIFYAILPTGRVLEAQEQQYSSEFTKGRVWKDSQMTAAQVRDRMAFIGNYPAPQVTK